jgi:hypothetical protein
VKLKRMGLIGVFAGAAVGSLIVLFLAINWFGPSKTIERWALPRHIGESNSCDASPNGNRAQTTDERRTATIAAWILGVREGGHAGWIKQIRGGAAIRHAPGMKDWLSQSEKHAAETNAAAERMTSLLQIKRPAPFAAAESGSSLDAFRDFMEEDRQPAARGLAEAYSRRLCDVYKLGAYWGFSILFRAAAPAKRNVFAPEIGFYGARLGMPDDHVDAMLDPSPTGLDSVQIQAASEQVTRRIAEYWNTQ